MAYPNLSAEMKRYNITEKHIAALVGRTPSTVKEWLKGEGDFPLKKAKKTQKELFPQCDFMYLFSEEPITPQ